MIVLILLIISMSQCEPMPSGRDCYNAENTTVPTIFCSAFLHCECSLCKRVGQNSNDEYCIAQTPSLNTSIWNCPTPYNQTEIDRCEATHAPARWLFITLSAVAAVFCIAGVVIFIVLYLRTKCSRNPYQPV